MEGSLLPRTEDVDMSTEKLPLEDQLSRLDTLTFVLEKMIDSIPAVPESENPDARHLDAAFELCEEVRNSILVAKNAYLAEKKMKPRPEISRDAFSRKGLKCDPETGSWSNKQGPLLPTTGLRFGELLFATHREGVMHFWSDHLNLMFNNTGCRDMTESGAVALFQAVRSDLAKLRLTAHLEEEQNEKASA